VTGRYTVVAGTVFPNTSLGRDRLAIVRVSLCVADAKMIEW